jgi:hypothetical protein
MKQGLPPQKLKQVWRQMTANAGKFKGTGKIKATPYHGDTIVFVKTLFAKKAFWTQVALNQSDKVAGLFFKPAG